MSLRASFDSAVIWAVLTGTLTLVAAPSAAGQGPPGMKTPPPGWSDAIHAMSDLALDGKHREMIAIAEKWTAKYPTFGEAHVMLGGGYESLGRDMLLGKVQATEAERVKVLETAASHYRRAFELGGERPEMGIRVLIDVYGLIGLNRPDEQEKVVREAVVRYPAEPLAHTELIARLLQKGDAAGVERAVAAARAALPKTADARLAVGSLLAFRAAGRDRMITLSPETSGAMAKVALRFVDDALAIDPMNAEALKAKASIEARAKRP